MNEMPKRFREFNDVHPEVVRAHQQLGEAVRSAGPLEDRTRELVHLAIAIGAGREGAVHSHTRKALDAGCSADEIRQAAILSIPTVGFPAAMAALSWIDDIVTQ